MEAKAHKLQQVNGVKSNRNIPKEDFTKNHRRTKLKKSEPDPRTIEVEVRLIHPRRSVMVKTIEVYRIESERNKWAKDGWELFLNN